MADGVVEGPRSLRLTRSPQVKSAIRAEFSAVVAAASDGKGSSSGPGAGLDVAGLLGVVEEMVERVEHDLDLLDEERVPAQDALERLQRLGADAELVARLAAAGFEGVEFQYFRAELAAYAIPVMRSWIRRGLIFGLCVQIERPVCATEQVRRHLAEDYDDRVGLADEVIAVALQVFCRYALIRQRWDPARGATLKTYFIGACLRAFPTVYRKWLRSRSPEICSDQIEAIIEHRKAPARDPAEIVASKDFVDTKLTTITKTDTREAAARIAYHAETFAEAGEAVGLNAKQVEGRLYRLRHQPQNRTRQNSKSQNQRRGEQRPGTPENHRAGGDA